MPYQPQGGLMAAGFTSPMGRTNNTMGAQWQPQQPQQTYGPQGVSMPNPGFFPKGYGDGMAPGGYGNPSSPPGTGPLPPSGPSSPAPQPGMQPGQYGWGMTFGGGQTPRYGASENLYINHMLHGSNNGVPPAWASQVDPNNLVASIGQLSGVKYDPNSPLWRV